MARQFALCVYEYETEDLEKLLDALKTGTLSSVGRCYTEDEIQDMMNTKVFRQRYGKYLRKKIHGHCKQP